MKGVDDGVTVPAAGNDVPMRVICVRCGKWASAPVGRSGYAGGTGPDDTPGGLVHVGKDFYHRSCYEAMARESGIDTQTGTRIGPWWNQ